MNWDEFFMRHAYLYAQKSKDESTQIGAVLVKNKTIISGGYNGICRGVDDTVETRLQRPEKYFWFEHAERNAIYNAARTGVSTIDSHLYTNGIPCLDCARGVIQAGVSKVFVHRQWDIAWEEAQKGNPQWQGRIERTVEMFDEAGVMWEYITLDFGIDLKVCGKLQRL